MTVRQQISSPWAASVPWRVDRNWVAARTAPTAVGVSILSLAIALFCFRDLLGTVAGIGWPVVTLITITLVIPACWVRGGTVAWVALLAGVNVFEALRAASVGLGIPVHADDLRQLEQTICFGLVPSHVLQTLFFTPGSLGVADYASVLVHGSFFVVPYAALAVVWVVSPHSTGRLAYPLLATFAIGLAINAALPAEPPWLESLEAGAPDVHRVLYLLTLSVVGTTRQLGESLGDPNPTACLPSLHFAITFLLFLYARLKGTIWAVAGGVYCLAMGFSLVYMGEHYVVDCIAGSLVALAAWHLTQRLHGRPAVIGAAKRV